MATITQTMNADSAAAPLGRHWGWLLASLLLGFAMGWIAVVHRGQGVDRLVDQHRNRERADGERECCKQAADCGADYFMLNVFLRDGDDIYRTYSTTNRGVDRLLFVNNILDVCPYGRQEDWEDSPPGWPQHPTYG